MPGTGKNKIEAVARRSLLRKGSQWRQRKRRQRRPFDKSTPGDLAHEVSCIAAECHKLYFVPQKNRGRLFVAQASRAAAKLKALSF